MAREVPVARRIDQDVGRFRRIVRGQVRKNLRKYVSNGELLGKVGKGVVSIPLPQIRLPRFTFGDNRESGVGMGEGEEGQPVPGQPQPGEAGEGEGDHTLEVDVPLPELAAILGEELKLPNIQPRGREHIVADVKKFRGIRRTGPEGLRHFRRTYKQALRRQIMSGTYDPARPIIVPRREDRRYRSWRVTDVPQSNAVLLYMMDVSGSMGTEQKEVVRITAFWIDTWLRSQYRNLETRFIVHDAAAREVDRHSFFHLRESGGTKISSAYELCLKMIEERYSPTEWNVYPFHFSDGDNWSGGDTRTCLRLLEDELLPRSNLFCYGQVKSAYGSGQFKVDLDNQFKDQEAMVTTEIPDRDGILDAIRNFLGTGR
ncbi:MAG: DUF444 family protein [Planctomycetota bacterium]|jgi:uncharacterized sporulation protein YeaH/YhbH (DUF444 family)